MNMRIILVFTLSLFFVISSIGQNNEKENTIKHGSDYPVFNSKNNIIYEDFEAGIMPPAGWTILTDTTPQTWDTATFDPHSGSYYAHCLYDETLFGTQDERLITPVFDLRGISSVVLSFYFQFSQYWGINPNDNYDLYVLASIDSGLTFPDTIWHELDTDTSVWTSFEWVNAQVDLADYIGDSTVALAFVYYGFNGAEAALDDIWIQTLGTIQDYEKTYSFYPNPVKEILYVQNENNIICFEIIDINGRIILSRTDNTKEMQIGLSSISKGIYFIRIQDEKGIYSEKIILK